MKKTVNREPSKSVQPLHSFSTTSGDDLAMVACFQTGAIRFATERLSVRPFTEAELGEFAAYRNNSEWMRFQGFKNRTPAEYRRVLLAPANEAEGLQLAILLRSTGRLAGDLYYRLEGDACHIGYTVAPEYARMGYATEAVQALLACLAARNVRLALAEVSPENTVSIALLVKAGFRQTGTNADGDALFSLSLR